MNSVNKAHEIRTQWSNEAIEIAIISPSASELLSRVKEEIDMDEILIKILSGKKVTLDGKKIMKKIKDEVLDKAGITHEELEQMK